MARYVLNFPRVPSNEEIESVTSSDKVHVLDSGDSMLLVEGEPDEVEKVAATIPDSTVVPERRYSALPEQGKVRLKLNR